ncbi:hypothetical protein P0F65_10555 [Sphingomonas sp. I4]
MMAPLTLFIALVLAISAAHKAHSPARLSNAAARLAGVSPPIGQLLLVLAGAIEAVAALCLTIPGMGSVGAAIAAAVWATYAMALWRRRGEVLDCGCDLVNRPRAVDAGQILRAALMATIALAVVAWPSPPSLEALIPALGLLALYVGASEILAIPRPAWRKA